MMPAAAPGLRAEGRAGDADTALSREPGTEFQDPAAPGAAFPASFPKAGAGVAPAASRAPRELPPFREGKPASWRGKGSRVQSGPGD